MVKKGNVEEVGFFQLLCNKPFPGIWLRTATIYYCPGSGAVFSLWAVAEVSWVAALTWDLAGAGTSRMASRPWASLLHVGSHQS